MSERSLGKSAALKRSRSTEGSSEKVFKKKKKTSREEAQQEGEEEIFPAQEKGEATTSGQVPEGRFPARAEEEGEEVFQKGFSQSPQQAPKEASAQEAEEVSLRAVDRRAKGRRVHGPVGGGGSGGGEETWSFAQAPQEETEESAERQASPYEEAERPVQIPRGGPHGRELLQWINGAGFAPLVRPDDRQAAEVEGAEEEADDADP